MTSRGVSTTPLADALQLRTPERPTTWVAWVFTIFSVGWAYFIGYITFVDEKKLPLVGNIFAFVVLGAWLPVLGLFLLIRAYSERRIFRAEEPSWQRAAWLWYHEARYCQRDHIVYLPDGWWASPDRTTGLVYEAAQRAMPAGNS